MLISLIFEEPSRNPPSEARKKRTRQRTHACCAGVCPEGARDADRGGGAACRESDALYWDTSRMFDTTDADRTGKMSDS